MLALSPLALAQAAEPVEVPKPDRTLVLASDYLKRELGARLSVKQGKSIQPDRASKNSYSAEQMAAVRKVFGSENPFQVKRLAATGGRTSYDITMPAHEFKDEKNTLAWSQAGMQTVVAPNGSQQFTGNLPSLTFSNSEGRFDLSAIRTSGTVKADLWSSKSRASIDQMRFTPAGQEDPGFTIADIRYDNEFKRQGQYFGGRSEINFGRSSAFGHAIDNLHMAVRFRKLDAVAMDGLRTEFERLRNTGDIGQSEDALLASFGPLVKRLVMRGAALEIEDISGSYNGHKVSIKGSLSMPNAKEADFASPPALIKKLAGSLEFSVPLPLLHEISSTIAAKYNTGKEGQQVPVDKMADQIYEAMLGKALANNYARIEKNALRSTIELKGGALAVNGTVVPLEALLALLEQKKLPPADTKAPEIISMRDRGLEAAQLFAMNGNHEGMVEMCKRYAQGFEVEKDLKQASKWCTKAWSDKAYYAAVPLGELFLDSELDDPAIPGMVRQAADAEDNEQAQFLMYRLLQEGKGVPKDQQLAIDYLRQAAKQGHKKAMAALKEIDAGVQSSDSKPSDESKTSAWDHSFQVPPGFYSSEEFAFAPARHRRMQVSLGNLKKHEKWGPMLAVCVEAMNPSDVACLHVTATNDEVPQVLVNSHGRATNGGEQRNIKWIEKSYKTGDTLDVVVYATGKEVHFIVDGDESLTQEVNFPVEVLKLACSTGDCSFHFQQPGEK